MRRDFLKLCGLTGLGLALPVGRATVAGEKAKDEPYAEIESLKTVSELSAPLSGEVVEVNDALAEGAGTINDDPHGRG